MCQILLIILLSIFPLLSVNFKYSAGANWNEIIFSELYEIVQGAEYKKGLTEVNAPFNSGPWFQIGLEQKLSDRFFFTAEYELGYEWKGNVYFDSSMQENPFSVIDTIAGSLSARFVVLSFNFGTEIFSYENFKLLGSLGYIHDEVTRYVDVYLRNEIFRFYSWYNAPVIALNAQTKIDKFTSNIKFAFSASHLNLIFDKYPSNNQILYYWPYVTGWKIAANWDYEINECNHTGLDLSWIVQKNVSDGCVKLPSNETRFRNNSAPFVRSQLWLVTAYWNHEF